MSQLILPPVVLALPFLVLYKALSFLDTRFGLILLYTLTVLPIVIWIMGTFLLLACDFRLGARGPHRMGLNEVAIGIAPPSFAIELARSRLHPAWLSRTATLGEMYEPDEALAAGFLDRVVAPELIDLTLAEITTALRSIHKPSHVREAWPFSK